MPFNLSPIDLVVILALVLLVFGPKKLPELAKGLGSAITEFKSAMSGNKDKDAATKRLEESETKKDEDKPNG